jgi:Skp family chaperone for outer membrane proteins
MMYGAFERKNVRRKLAVLMMVALVPMSGAVACGQAIEDRARQEVDKQVEKGKQRVNDEIQKGQKKLEDGAGQVQKQVEDGAKKAQKQAEQVGQDAKKEAGGGQ